MGNMSWMVEHEVYVNYVRHNYGSVIVIFDGYNDEHMRWTGSKGSSMNVVIKEGNEVPYSKERYIIHATRQN